MKCPCKGCLMIPMCKHKFLSVLLECEPMKVYLMKYTFFLTSTKRRIRLRQGVVDILKPTKWDIDRFGCFTGFTRGEKEFAAHG